MPNKNGLKRALKKHNVSDEIIEQIMNVSYEKSNNDEQDKANFFGKAMSKCDELIALDTLTESMCEMSCCRDGEMLQKTQEFKKEHENKPIDEKIKLLEHISKPWFIDENHLASYITGKHETVCSCWELNGHTPNNNKMSLSYCFCCAGFLKFHYQEILGLELRVDKMTSSLLNGDKRCAVVFEILNNDNNTH